jgi:ATP-binding cassette, subfamily B, bacterial
MSNPYFNLIKTVWHNGQPWRRTIIGYYCAFTLAQLFLSLSPYAFGRTINILQDFTPDKLNAVILWLSVGIVVLLLFWLLHGPGRVQERFVALKIQQAFRIRLYEQLTQLPLKWHQDHHSGNIITRVNRAAAALYRFAAEQFIYIETFTKFIISISFLLWISLPVGLLSILTCVVASFAVMFFDRKLIPLYDAENEIDNHVGAVFFDYISNMTTILTLRLGNLTRTNMFQRMMTIWPFFRQDAILNEVKWFSMGVLLNSIQSIILIGYIVYHLKSSDSIMIGTVVMIFRYQWEIGDVFFVLSTNYSELVRMNTDMQGLQPILNDVARLAHAPEGEAVARQWHTIAIKDLVFYHAKEVNHTKLFDHLNLTIKRGENIALIGASGGGKSTLLNLLRGLYRPEQVQLTIDDVTFASLEALQSITTLIPQDPEVFENTIAFNITMDVPTKPEAIHAAITLAGFNNVLATLPQGLATDMRERGLNLSVGQKQRLALARGLFAARFSSLILIDEPTSSVDLPTEKEILAGVLDAFPDASIVVSLHRLHLLPKFDRIIMLSDGGIIADGLTVDLLKQPGPVYDLWQAYQYT